MSEAPSTNISPAEAPVPKTPQEARILDLKRALDENNGYLSALATMKPREDDQGALEEEKKRVLAHLAEISRLLGEAIKEVLIEALPPSSRGMRSQGIAVLSQDRERAVSALADTIWIPFEYPSARGENLAVDAAKRAAPTDVKIQDAGEEAQAAKRKPLAEEVPRHLRIAALRRTFVPRTAPKFREAGEAAQL